MSDRSDGIQRVLATTLLPLALWPFTTYWVWKVAKFRDTRRSVARETLRIAASLQRQAAYLMRGIDVRSARSGVR